MINKAILIGNVGQDPEFRTAQNGMLIANFSLATQDPYAKETDWHKIVAFSKDAEIIQEYVKKGDKIYVEGMIKNRKYTNSSGLEKNITEIKLSRLQMLGNSNKKDDNAL